MNTHEAGNQKRPSVQGIYIVYIYLYIPPPGKRAMGYLA